MQAALNQLLTFHKKNQVLIKNCGHGNSRFHNKSAILAAFGRHLGRFLHFSKTLFLAKLQQILLELVENMCF